MRALLVDEEPLALEQLKRLLQSGADGVEVVEMCSDSYKAVESAIKQRPDVVFLDIHMPGIGGFELAERMQAALPGVEIVFVTADDQCAVKAFELNALDYIIKPVYSDRLRLTVERLRGKVKENGGRSNITPMPVIHTFNRLRVQLPGQEPRTVPWRTSKAQELFAYLLHHRGKTIQRSVLIELLWPGFEVARATQQLYTAIYHIRKTLKGIGLGTVSISGRGFEAGYRMDVGDVRVDAEEWEKQLNMLGPVDPEHLAEHEEVFRRFEGNYLGDYDYLWAEHERERLRLLWLGHARHLSEFYIKQGRLEKVIQIKGDVQHRIPDIEMSTTGRQGFPMKSHANFPTTIS